MFSWPSVKDWLDGKTESDARTICGAVWSGSGTTETGSSDLQSFGGLPVRQLSSSSSPGDKASLLIGSYIQKRLRDIFLFLSSSEFDQVDNEDFWLDLWWPSACWTGSDFCADPAVDGCWVERLERFEESASPSPSHLPVFCTKPPLASLLFKDFSSWLFPGGSKMVTFLFTSLVGEPKACLKTGFRFVVFLTGFAVVCW